MRKQIVVLVLLALLSIQSCQKPNPGKGPEAGTGLIPKLSGSSQTDCWTAFLQEPTLDFGSRTDPSNDYMYSAERLREGMLLFSQYYLYMDATMNQPGTLTNDTGKLNVGGLRKMIADTRLYMKNRTANYLCGLKMRYGLSNRSTVLIYEPVALVDPRLDGDWIADTLGTGTFYKTDASGTPEQISRTEMEKYTDNYDQKAYIIHLEPDQASVHSFVRNEGNPRLGDAHFCVMPMQELVRLYTDNLDDCAQAQETDILWLSLVANPFSRMPDAGYSRNLKPHVVIYTNRIGTGLGGNGFKYLGADFGQMCPPNCKVVKIPPM